MPTPKRNESSIKTNRRRRRRKSGASIQPCGKGRPSLLGVYPTVPFSISGRTTGSLGEHRLGLMGGVTYQDFHFPKQYSTHITVCSSMVERHSDTLHPSECSEILQREPDMMCRSERTAVPVLRNKNPSSLRG